MHSKLDIYIFFKVCTEQVYGGKNETVVKREKKKCMPVLVNSHARLNAISGAGLSSFRSRIFPTSATQSLGGMGANRSSTEKENIMKKREEGRRT